MENIIKFARYIDTDMREIAERCNQGYKADAEEIEEWARLLLSDVKSFCKSLDKKYNTEILEEVY